MHNLCLSPWRRGSDLISMQHEAFSCLDTKRRVARVATVQKVLRIAVKANTENMVYYTVIMRLKESNLLTPQLRLIDVAYVIL